tara:strand:- start:277 stop:453 length:177 start_codon:yes stop_codon:yes gene_type:complete
LNGTENRNLPGKATVSKDDSHDATEASLLASSTLSIVIHSTYVCLGEGKNPASDQDIS